MQMFQKIKKILIKLYYAFLSIVAFIKLIPKKIYESIFCLLPIKKNRIVFSSFTGRNYSCNPRAIYEYLLHNYPGKFEYIWLFDYNFNPEIPCIVKDNAKCVQFNSVKSSYYKATSGIWCFNHRNTKYFHKKKNQFYIQTWHGDIGIKTIEKKAFSPDQISSPYLKKSVIDSAMTDVLIVGSDWGYRNMYESFFFENGEYLKSGCPRNDILFDHSKDYLIKTVREKYNIDVKTKICLYTPTFRKGFTVNELLFNSTDVAKEIITALKQKFGGEWVLFIKYHPACLTEVKKNGVYFCDSKSVFDVTDYGDVADLLVASDAMIADFSSVAFDFGLTRKPCWLYFKDIKNYCENEAKMAMDINDIKFPLSYSEEELIEQIKAFDSDEYVNEINTMYKNFGVNEDGNACKKIAERIEKYLNS